MRVETSSAMSDLSNAFTQRAALPEQRCHGFGQNEAGGMRPQQSPPQMTQHQMNSALARGDHPVPDEGDEDVMNEEEANVRSSSRKTDLEVELASKQREVSHLVDEMERLQSSINSFKEISTTKISQLEDIVNEKDRIIKDLAEKLLRQQDYCDLKRELRLLKSLEAGGWQPWCIAASEQAEPASPEPKADVLVTEPNVNSNGRATSPGVESASPSSGTHEDPGSVPTTPPSASESSSQPRSPLAEQILANDGGVTVQRLHRYLRANVDRFSGESLDTLGIARCVRELLSVHNIGQRVFAKLVLGLSQGTVSELLSKPKPWDKLTEKGRDSYRKMHAWACDQQCVHLLKGLLPRKGREPGAIKVETTSSDEPRTTASADTPSTTTGPANGHPDNDQKDSDITQEPQNSGQTKLVNCHDTHQHHYRMPHNHPFHHTLGLGKQQQQHGFPCGPTEFPPVMLAHLYQEELLKLIGKRLKEGYAEDRAKQAQEDVRQALSIYHRELALLAQQGVLGNPRPPPNSSPINHSPPCHSCTTVRRPNCSLPYCPSDQQQQQQQPCCRPVDRGPQQAGPYSVISPYSGTSPLVPLPSEGAQAPGGEETSPLQRMQSITNSLLSQNSSPSFANLPQRPAKAVLPPITQQQFDQYNNLNTEDIVKRVKEQLSQYSISQRLFGENVLGLSQGSVSDLLARPKPWHMLTQKGREPFIRMKMFLEDESAVHKLVASQYKIAPERLMRIGGYNTGPPHPGTTGNIPPSSTRYGSMCAEPPYALHHRVAANDGRPLPPKPSLPSSVPSSPQTPTSTPDRDALPQGPRSPSGPCPATLPPKPGPNRRTVGHHTRCLPCVQPSVYEMAAVTTDLDTHTVTARIKETLTVHNIGQKLFGEAVLGLSQGSVSELLSKPKPWHMLSIKGREPFIRMQLWLSDPSNVEKLQTIKSERREANKRRRNNMEHDMHPSLHTDKAPPLPPYPLDLPPVFLYPPAKKPRILFSEEQKEALRLAYTLDPYPSTAVMEFLSNELGLSVRTITNWFHNHRMRLKQLSPVGSGSSDEPEGSGFNRPPGLESSSTFDPIRFRLLLGQRLAEMCSQQQSQEPHMLPYFTEPLRLCPPPNYPSPDTTPLPQSGGDSDTLDLSMSSQKFPQKQPNQESIENAAGSAVDSVHSTSGDSPGADDSKTLLLDNASYQSDDNATNNNARNKPALSAPSTSTETMMAAYEDSRLRGQDTNLANLVTSSGTSISSSMSNVQQSGSGSNRRKPAAPQWVNPGLDLSPDSDIGSYGDSDNEGDYVDYDDDLDNDELQWREDSEDANSGNKQIINGVCVRQTDLIPVENQRILDSEVVHVVPTPASDDSEKAKDEREKNIRRLERAIVEQDDAWEFTDSEADDDDDRDTQNNILSGP